MTVFLLAEKTLVNKDYTRNKKLELQYKYEVAVKLPFRRV